MKFIIRIYDMLLHKYPFITQSTQTAILMGTGDVIAQTMVENKPLTKLNAVRTCQFAGVGLFLAGPTLTMWYRALARLFGDQGGKSVALKKVALDQLLFAPCFIAVLLTSLGVVQGKKSSAAIHEVKRNYPDILVRNYQVWPWIQLGNFYVVPVRYQVLVVQVAAIFWNTYLSWKTQTAEAESQTA